MRRYKIVACILLILSLFSFVLAAPISIREIREARTDAVDGGNNMIIGSEKRGQEDGEPLLAGQEPSSSSTGWSTPSQHQGSSSVPDYYGGTLTNPSSSSGESKPLLSSTSGGTELSWNSEGKGKLIQPAGTSVEMQPWASWASTKPEIQPVTSTNIRPASPSLDKSVSFAPLRGVMLPTGEMYREFEPEDTVKPPLPPSPGPEREKNLLKLQIAKLKKPPPSQGKKLWKNIYSHLRKIKFWR